MSDLVKATGLKVNKLDERLPDVPVVFINYAEVRANSEEVYLIMYTRMDPTGEIKNDKLHVDVVPQQMVIMSPGHARRFAKAINSQVDKLYGDGKADDDE